ncbi:hypothetical protein RclHR1_14360002 [Rhizophagus clarus]|uniref:Transmembrane protein n=1 Tax=Rhizophagus clarus TaxID=94130 RepID=A0A2Z6QCI9_9GLOM|nr:hypothetical protein RclHR1_14360002 [Rhizophagus clarus]GES86007.1 hypothetical protein GLOIN_2v1509369 [Rhizophagus clarus]
MKTIRHKIRLIIYTLIISLFLSLLFHSKFTNSFELDSTDSFVNLFITPQPPPILPVSPSSLSAPLPVSSLLSKKRRNCNFGCILSILLIVTLTSICLTFIIRKFIYNQRKLKDVEFGSYYWENERQRIINERRKKRISYIIQNQLPTIYEEYENYNIEKKQ